MSTRLILLAIVLLCWSSSFASGDDLLKTWSRPDASIKERAAAVNRAFTNGTPVSVVVAALGTNYELSGSSARIWLGSGAEPPNTFWFSYQFGEDAVSIGTSAVLGRDLDPLSCKFTGAGYTLTARASIRNSEAGRSAGTAFESRVKQSLEASGCLTTAVMRVSDFQSADNKFGNSPVFERGLNQNLFLFLNPTFMEHRAELEQGLTAVIVKQPFHVMIKAAKTNEIVLACNDREVIKLSCVWTKRAAPTNLDQKVTINFAIDGIVTLAPPGQAPVSMLTFETTLFATDEFNRAASAEALQRWSNVAVLSKEDISLLALLTSKNSLCKWR